MFFLYQNMQCFVQIVYKIPQESIFFQILSAKTKTLSPIFKFCLNFLLFVLYCFSSYLFSLSWTSFVFSILWKLKSVLNLSLDKYIFSILSGLRLSFSLWTLFLLSAELKITFFDEIFNFWGFNFDILVITLFRMGIFGAAHGWGEGQKGHPPKHL